MRMINRPYKPDSNFNIHIARNYSMYVSMHPWCILYVAHWSRFPKIISFHVFCTPGFKWDVKWCKNLQGTQFFDCFSARIEYPSKYVKKCHLWDVFSKFFQLCLKNSGSNPKIQISLNFCFIWHPAWPQGRKSKADITVFTLCFEIWWQWGPLQFFSFPSK